MAGQFLLKVISQFSAAHILHGYDGPCSRLHGHNWHVEAEVKAVALDNIGMAIDFKTVRRALENVIERLDHRFLNEIPPFDSINPTAENVAAWIYQEIKPFLTLDGVQLLAINLWETDNARVRYSEDM